MPVHLCIQRGGYFAGGIFCCGKFRISNVCEISRSIFKPLCEINPVQNLATGVHFHYLFILSFELLSVGRGWRRPLNSGLPPRLEGVYTRTVKADVPGRGKGSGESRIRVKDQGIPVNEGFDVCCAPKQIKGLVLDCLEPWGMGLRSRSCRKPLKIKNAILEAPGSSQNNPGTSWNLAVQGRKCSVVNSTILEGCEISRGIYRPLCEINPVRKIPGAKNSLRETPPPPV